MSLAYGLTFFCDALLYFGCLGCLGLLRACREDIFLVPLLLLAGCWLSGRLTGRGKPWLRWLPMAVAVPCLIVAGNGPGRLAALPMLAYLPLYVNNNRRAPDYDYAADRFRHSLIVAGAALLLAAMFHAASWPRGLPYLFAYFTLSMTLLRLLRHDDRVARSRRFRLLNLGGVALVCAAGFGLSQPRVFAAIRQGWQWFLERVVLNLITLTLYAIQLVLYAGAWLLSRLPGMDAVGMNELPELAVGADSQPMFQEAAAEVRALPPALRIALQAVGIALLAVVVLAVLRALSQRVGRAESGGEAEEREALDREAPPERRGPRLRRAPEEGVRLWYRRSLTLLRARGGRVSPTMNTLQIQEENAEIVDASALRDLREVYLPVRYGGRIAGAGEIKRAKEAYGRMLRQQGSGKGH